MQNENLLLGNHDVKINDRKNIIISGVKKIASFDSEEFIIETNMGVVVLKGQSLELVKLDTSEGNVKIKGKICGYNYMDGKEKNKEESFISKLFK